MTNGSSTSSLSGQVVWVDGQMIGYEDATVHVLSHATQRGTTVFDVIKVVDIDSVPHAIGLAGHVERFFRSMELMGMDAPYSVGELCEAITATVGGNPGASIVKLVAAWAEIPLRTLPLSPVPKIWIAATRSGPNADTPKANGVRLRTAAAPKMPAEILPPSLKIAAGYTAGVRERMAAVADGYDDVLFRTLEGDLAEATTQSLAVISGRAIALPPLDIVLDSITRRMMIEVVRHAGFRVEIRPVKWSEVEQADEMYLSSANYCALPVESLDNRPYASPGPITKEIVAQADLLVKGRHELSPRWLTPLQ